MVKLSAAQERNYREAFATTRSWAGVHGKDPEPLLDRVSMVLLTESNGRNYANDGLAYADNAEKVRPGWVVEADGKPMTLAKRAAIRGVLRKSLDMPNDGIGNNGGSTGCIQQLSQEFVGVRFPGKTWGYGSVAATMDVGNAVSMFLGRLVVTDNPDYAGITFSDPLVADVLRVQQPLISEHESSNYNASQVATAKAIVAQLAPEEKDGLDMATVQDVSTAVADQVGAVETRLNQKIDQTKRELADRMVDGDVMNAQAKAIFAADTGAGSSYAAQIATQTRMIDNLVRKVQWLIDQQPATPPATVTDVDAEQ